MSRSWTVTLVLLVSIVLIVTAAEARATVAASAALQEATAQDEGSRDIRGVVTTRSGAPVEGARIALEPLRDLRRDADASQRSAAAQDRRRGENRTANRGSDRGSGRGQGRNAARGRGFGGFGGMRGSSDADGAFTIEATVQARAYRIVVSAPGYATYRSVLMGAAISDGGSVTVRMIEGQAATQMPWLASLGAALGHASETDKPVMVFLTMDGEGANDFMAANTYRRDDIINLAQHIAPVVTNITVHAENADDECPKYGRVSCTNHVEAEAAVTSTLFAPGQSIQVPHHIFLTAGARMIERREFLVDASTLANMMMRAIRTVSPQRARAAAAVHYSNLLNDLESERAGIRNRALEGLMRLADSGDEIARTALFEVDPARLSPDQEDDLLDRLLSDPTPDLADGIARLLQAGSATLRANAIRRLADIHTADSTRLGALTALVRTLSAARDASLRTAIEVAIGVQRQSGSLQYTGAAERYRFAVASALARHGDPAALEELSRTLETSNDPRRRADAAIAMLAYPSRRVLPILADELGKGGADRAVLARILGETGDQDAAPALLQALSDASLSMRATAASALGMLGYQPAAAPLATLARDESQDSSVRVAAAAALIDLGIERASVDVLIEYADHPVHYATAREALSRARASRPPESSSDWKEWWENQRRGG